ncbi:MAG: diaminopimelate dehydrogenase [Methanosarcinales archaeon]|nr:diaminopimelate dehydrogenase [Methanosarcinales archaeon]
MEKIKIAIIGYGNIGKAVELATQQTPDIEPVVILTRRSPDDIKPATQGLKVDTLQEAEKYAEQVDVAVLCGGSATDLPVQGPMMAAIFNTVDSYDTHALIPKYYQAVDQAARKAGNTAVISTGWDPGLFSLMRVIEDSVLPVGTHYTFWGPGVSQGHSDAVRRVKGVRDARQYTIPIEQAVEKVRSGSEPGLATRDMHLRDCYVVAEEGADKKQIEAEIKNMPYYFDAYDTRVTFISKEEMEKNHSQMPHGGFVMRGGRTGEGYRHVIEFSLKLESNPAFTASVLLAYARAAHRLNRDGQIGAKTVLDIAPGLLSPRPPEELRRDML